MWCGVVCDVVWCKPQQSWFFSINGTSWHVLFFIPHQAVSDCWSFMLLNNNVVYIYPFIVTFAVLGSKFKQFPWLFSYGLRKCSLSCNQESTKRWNKLLHHEDFYLRLLQSPKNGDFFHKRQMSYQRKYYQYPTNYAYTYNNKLSFNERWWCGRVQKCESHFMQIRRDQWEWRGTFACGPWQRARTECYILSTRKPICCQVERHPLIKVCYRGNQP